MCLGTHLFVKVPRPGLSEVIFSVFESSCHLLHQSNHSKVEAIPLSALPKDTTSELAGLKMLNVKQGSCEYQLLKSFGQGIKSWSTDYDANALTTEPCT